MTSGGNWWRANEIVIRHLIRQTVTRYRCCDRAGAMFIAGVFGTIFGDLVAHATTFFAAFLTLGAALALVVYARRRLAPAAIIGYWAIVLVERAAGTRLGDWLDSRHGLGLGLPIASTITMALLLAALEWRRRATSARP